MNCPNCGTEQPAGNNFCEDCGARMIAAAGQSAPVESRCPTCNAGPANIDAQGFCTRCGCERAATGRDYFEIAVSPAFAGVCDRGHCKHRNEDYLALAAAPEGQVAVVCDGVSSSQNCAQAAEMAANATRESLMFALTSGAVDMRPAVVSAMRHAADAVHGIAFQLTDTADPPETTIVAAVRSGHLLTIGWLGDSRAYLVDGQLARQLTVDHSWVNEVVAAGEMTLDEAMRRPQAHSITRTLGGPIAGGQPDEPSLLSVDLPADSATDRWLVVCTDGFWYCLPQPAELAKLIAKYGGGDALSLAKKLVEHASRGPGKDNITVALLKL